MFPSSVGEISDKAPKATRLKLGVPERFLAK